jgi:hypothetical protein
VKYCLIFFTILLLAAAARGQEESSKPMFLKLNRLSLNATAATGDYFTLDSVRPDILFNAGFSASADVFGVPFNYSYSNGNSFGSSFIAPQFKMRLDVNSYKSRFVIPDFALTDSLQSRISTISDLMATNQKELNSIYRHHDQLKEMEMPLNQTIGVDSLHFNSSKFESLDSLSYLAQQKQQELDSLYTLVSSIQGQLDSIRKLQVPKPTLLIKKPNVSLTNVEFGLCQPKIGSYILSGTMLRGGLLGLKIKNIEHTISAGLVSNFVMNELSGSPVQRLAERIDRIQNFNFQNSQRFIGAYQIMFGKQDSSHFYASVLYGLGKRNILSSSNERARNVVGEVGKGIYHPLFGLLTVSISQSFITNMIGSSSENLGLQKDRGSVGYGFKANIKGSIEALKIEYSFKNELLTPAFNSYGVALQRRDFWSLTGQVTKRFKVPMQLGINYRRDMSNVFKSGLVSLLNEQYRFRYSQKLKKVVFVNNDLFYLRSKAWSNDFSQLVETYIASSAVTIVFPKSKTNESIVGTAVYNGSSDNSCSVQSNIIYSFSPSGKVTFRNMLSQQITRYADNTRQEVFNGSVAVDYTLKTCGVSLTVGTGFINENLDWNAGLSLSKLQGRVTGSLSVDKYLIDDINNFTTLDLNRTDRLGWRALVTLNYNIIGN